MKNILKNWKTTLAGIISLVLLILVNSGVISSEESEELGGLSSKLINNADAIVALFMAAALIFSKDADVIDGEQKTT